MALALGVFVFVALVLGVELLAVLTLVLLRREGAEERRELLLLRRLDLPAAAIESASTCAKESARSLA